MTPDDPLPSDKRGKSPQHLNTHPSEGWRVKLYRLNTDGSWDDCGTGSILCVYKKTPHINSSDLTGDAWVYQELGEPTLCMHAEVKHSSSVVTSPPRILLRTRILLRDAYQRQGDNIITWCEPYLEDGNPAQGVDLALSFQDIAGCLYIWRQITQVQSKAAELFREAGSQSNRQHSFNSHDRENGDRKRESKTIKSVEEMAHATAAAHHANLQRQQQQEMWMSVASEAAQHHLDHQSSHAQHNQDHHSFGDTTMTYHDTCSGVVSTTQQSLHLPNPPRLANLEEIADMIAAVQHMQQRESLAMFIAQNECSYLKSLLSLFPSAENRGDYGSLATLAACVKTILLLNDPSIIELIVSDELIFEEVCSTLEYDPDLRDKANHRWFLRERAKFRTVVLIEDEELVASIHRSFRITYLRDTLLRPTMDESSLSTLSSLQTFTHADVVKGVTMSPAASDDKGELLKDSYLAKVIRVLGRELEAICEMEWQQVEDLPPHEDLQACLSAQAEDSSIDTSTVVVTGKYPQSQNLSRVWKQYLAPQDESLASRRIRRRGSLSFLRELFNMVRISLQQSDKDDFFAVLVSMEVDLDYKTNNMTDSQTSDATNSRQMNNSESKQKSDDETLRRRDPSRSVNLLALLGTVLADPHIDVTDKGSVLEILSGIAMHEPSLIRRRCLESFMAWRKDRRVIENFFDSLGPIRLQPNEKRQILFHCPPNDFLGSLMFLLVTETDAGLLLQVSEIMRIILDTEMMTDHGPMAIGFSDEVEGLPGGGGTHNLPHEQQHVNNAGTFTSTTDQNQFLSMFYNNYVQLLASPFHYKILYPVRRIPRKVLEAQVNSATLQKMVERFQKGQGHEEPLLCMVTKNSVRSSFAVELLSFCVRAHIYRMKSYVLRSRVLGNVLKVLNKPNASSSASGERCLTLSALRFLRSILSVNDEFYHRHIIQHDLFSPVFEAFRANPVGDNLVSSAIVEMCDFIRAENIKVLLEHIVTKHLARPSTLVPSLEDVSSPYVNTFTILRKAYEKNIKGTIKAPTAEPNDVDPSNPNADVNSGYFHGSSTGRSSHVVRSEKAREDQRKFREVDEEESYFDADDDDSPSGTTSAPSGDETKDMNEKNIHRTQRMLSLTQGQLLNGSRLDGEKLLSVADFVGRDKNHLEEAANGVS